MRTPRDLIRCILRRRPEETLNISITADVEWFVLAMLAAQQQTRRLLRTRRVNRDLAWIRGVAADELALGRIHVRRLADQTYTDLGLTRLPVTRHDSKDHR